MIRGGKRRKRLAPTSPGCFWRRRGRLVNDQVDTGQGTYSLVRMKLITFLFSKEFPYKCFKMTVTSLLWLWSVVCLYTFAMTEAKKSDKYMSSHFHFFRWPEIVFHCKNVPSASIQHLQNLEKHEQFNFGTEGGLKEGLSQKIFIPFVAALDWWPAWWGQQVI